MRCACTPARSARRTARVQSSMIYCSARVQACAQPTARCALRPCRAGFLLSLLEDAHDKTQLVPLTPCFCTHAAVAISANILLLTDASIRLGESLDMFCGDAGDAGAGGEGDRTATRNASERVASPCELERAAACGRLSHQCLLNVLKSADFLDIECLRSTALLEVMGRVLKGTFPADLASDAVVLDALLAVAINRTQSFHSEWRARQSCRIVGATCDDDGGRFHCRCTCSKRQPAPGGVTGSVEELVCDFCLFAHAGSPFRVLTMLVKRGIFAEESRVLDLLLHDRAIASQCQYYYAPSPAVQGIWPDTGAQFAQEKLANTRCDTCGSTPARKSVLCAH